MMARVHSSSVRRRTQRGIALLEALLAVLMLAIGLMGTLAMQARSVADLSEAGLRAEATIAANQLLGAMNADRKNLLSYGVSAGGAPAGPTADWHNEVLTRVPGAKVEVKVADKSAEFTNRVEVDIAIGWQRTGSSQANVHRIKSYLSKITE